MVRRLWHVLVIGHQWVVASARFTPGDPKQTNWMVMDETRKQIGYGWTEVWLRCRCGTDKAVRLIGDHSGVQGAAELVELERLANL